MATISQWNPERGFGFTTVNGKRVFVHFTALNPRPARDADLTGRELSEIQVDWKAEKGPRVTSATLLPTAAERAAAQQVAVDAMQAEETSRATEQLRREREELHRRALENEHLPPLTLEEFERIPAEEGDRGKLISSYMYVWRESIFRYHDGRAAIMYHVQNVHGVPKEEYGLKWLTAEETLEVINTAGIPPSKKEIEAFFAAENCPFDGVPLERLNSCFAGVDTTNVICQTCGRRVDGTRYFHDDSRAVPNWDSRGYHTEGGAGWSPVEYTYLPWWPFE